MFETLKKLEEEEQLATARPERKNAWCMYFISPLPVKPVGDYRFARVLPSVRHSVRPSFRPPFGPSVPFRVRSITLSFGDGFLNNFVEMLTMLRRCVARMSQVCTTKVKVTLGVKGQFRVHSITLSFSYAF